jgi:hypothetical protein
MVIAESAMLNIGHILISIKSRTWPYKMRSIRFPIAPAKIKNSPITVRGDLGLLKISAYIIKADVTKEIATSKKRLCPLNKPKAIPLL